MEPDVQIMFGTKRTVQTFEDGSILEKLESMHSGRVVGEYVQYKETIKDPTESEIIAQFIDFQEFIRKDRRRLNPVFEQKTDEGTGRTLLIYKSWTERIK